MVPFRAVWGTRDTLPDIGIEPQWWGQEWYNLAFQGFFPAITDFPCSLDRLLWPSLCTKTLACPPPSERGDPLNKPLFCPVESGLSVQTSQLTSASGRLALSVFTARWDYEVASNVQVPFPSGLQ